jgi:hypothetical protein
VAIIEKLSPISEEHVSPFVVLRKLVIIMGQYFWKRKMELFNSFLEAPYINSKNIAPKD